jgi:DNA-binding MarR family transcriptional regulator
VPSPAPVPPPDDTAATAARLSLAITRLRSRLREEDGMNATGLSVSQLAVLLNVVEAGPVTAADLAVSQHVSPQSIAQNVATLREAGLVRAERDPADGRKTLLRADPAGTELVAALAASRTSFLARAIDALISPAERPELARTIELLERFAAADLDGRR